jgi:hypothetical protein
MNILILAGLIAVLVAILGWHMFFAGAIAITAAVWTIVVASVIIFSIGILLLLMLTGITVFIVSIIGFVWTVLAVILFPALFPILIPLLIILLCISYLRRKLQRKQSHFS